MRLSQIALHNVRRHPARMALLAVLIISVVSIVGAIVLVTLSARQDLANKVDEYGANITVVPLTDQLPLVYGGVRVGDITYDAQPLTMDDVALIRTIPNKENINKVAPKLLELGEIEGIPLAVVGVDWDEELAMKKWWRIVGSAPQAPTDMLLGAKAAERLGLAAGDTASLEERRFRVTGVIEATGGEEDNVAFIALSTAQRLFDRAGEVSFAEVSAWCSSCPIETISSQIATLLPGARVTALKKAIDSRSLLIDQFRLFSIVLSVFLGSAGALVVLTSTLSRVRERKSEIGVFRALGYRRRHILEIVMIENLIVGAIAAAIGVGLAWAGAGPVARLVAGVSTVVTPRLEVFGLLAVGALVMVLVATLYPAWQAARLSPLSALRRV